MQRRFRLLSLVVLLCLITSAAKAATISLSAKTQNCGSYCYGPPSYYHADLNNDGREDLVWIPATYYGQIGYINVQLSTGDGTYASPVAVSVPNTPGIFALVIADFTGDGNADIAAFATDDNLYLYRNNGAGSFTLFSTEPYTTGNVGNASADAGDFNHDGIEDLDFLVSGVLHIWFGNGKGGFTQGPATPVNDSAILTGAADFDGDGIADVALADGVTPTTIDVLYGDNTGHFLHTTTVTVGRGVYSTGDVNSDGKTDLISAPYPDTSVKNIAVFYGNAARIFVNHTIIPTKYCPSGAVSTVDLDGNGLKDILVPESACGTAANGTDYLGVRTRNPDSSYNAEQTIYTASPTNGIPFPIPYPPLAIRADRNTKPDVILTHCLDNQCETWERTVLLNSTSGNFPTCAAPNGFQGINICSPGSSASSPTAFAIGATGPVLMRKVEIWVDGKKLVEQLDGFSNYSFLNHSLSLTAGSHAVTVYAAGWDNWLEKKSFTLQVK